VCFSKPGVGWYYGRNGMDIKAFIWELCMHMAKYFALASDYYLRVDGWNGSGRKKYYTAYDAWGSLLAYGTC